METNINVIKGLLTKRAELQSRINLLPYDGNPEIKEKGNQKYIYIRKKELGIKKSKYVGVFSESLFNIVQRQWLERKELTKQIRQIEKLLAKFGYSATELSPTVELNLEFARINMKANIYDQAVLEGVATTFPQTETIIENGIVSGVRPEDVQKILNLKHAWEFVMDKDVIQYETDYYILCYIARLVNEGFYEFGGKIRQVPVAIGGSSYVPPIPVESDVKEKIKEIVSSNSDDLEKAIQLCLYCMKTQIFNDGNKRTAVIFANHYLISKGKGLIVIPEKDVSEFKKLLIAYYEGKNISAIKKFMKEKCWRKFDH